MINDSVREELATKISTLAKPKITPQVPAPLPVSQTIPVSHAIPAIPVSQVIPAPPKPMVAKQETGAIVAKNTSPTLVEFQNKNAALPEWRLQLQNSVRKRRGESTSGVSVLEAAPQHAAARSVSLVSSGATALNADQLEKVETETKRSPAIENALKRIEQSRRLYSKEEKPVTAANAVMQFPSGAGSSFTDFAAYRADVAPTVPTVSKSNVVTMEPRPEPRKEKFDTNKLPPLPQVAKISSSFSRASIHKTNDTVDFRIDDLDGDLYHGDDVVAYGDATLDQLTIEAAENDDFAPVSLRFNAALFDLLIGSFLSLIFLSPFMLLNGRFFSLEGLYAFLATTAIVMFIYLTTTVGFLGRSFGMRLFKLEVIDVDGTDYPSLHQAAVSSSIYLLSMAFGGIGFLTMLLNSERRAVHDLVSGTIVVKEY
jgi:uncharacterized RDD family membrane protein YckC